MCESFYRNCKPLILARIVKYNTWCFAKRHSISQIALTQYHPWKGVTSPGAALFGDVLQPAGSSAASSQSKVKMTSALILGSSSVMQSVCKMCFYDIFSIPSRCWRVILTAVWLTLLATSILGMERKSEFEDDVMFQQFDEIMTSHLYD